MGLSAFRLPDQLSAEVDRYAKRAEAERLGTRITRAEAVRELLMRALRDAPARPRRGA